MKRITLILLVFNAVLRGQVCAGNDTVEISNIRTSTCLKNVVSKGILGQLYDDSYKVNIQLIKNNSTVVLSKTFLPSEFTSFNNGKYEYSLADVNVSKHNDAYAFTAKLLVYRTEYEVVFSGPFPIVVPYIVPVSQCDKFVYRCLNDFDFDGIVNNSDSCPNVPNTGVDDDNDGIDNACDTTNSIVDLTVDLEVSVAFSQCITCNPLLSNFLMDGDRHLIIDGTGNINFDKLQVRNIGGIASNRAKVYFYFSTNEELDQNDQKLKEVTIPSRNPNSSYGISDHINGWDFNRNGDLASGNYFILIKIDATNTNNEGANGENDNLLSIPIKYNKITKGLISVNNFNRRSKNIANKIFQDFPYNIEVFSIHGQKILFKKVSNFAEEKEIVKQLPKGFYVIKNSQNTYKVMK